MVNTWQNQNRVPEGVPTGGEWAEGMRTEPAITSAPTQSLTHLSHDERLAIIGGGALSRTDIVARCQTDKQFMLDTFSKLDLRDPDDDRLHTDIMEGNVHIDDAEHAAGAGEAALNAEYAPDRRHSEAEQPRQSIPISSDQQYWQDFRHPHTGIDDELRLHPDSEQESLIAHVPYADEDLINAVAPRLRERARQRAELEDDIYAVRRLDLYWNEARNTEQRAQLKEIVERNAQSSGADFPDSASSVPNSALIVMERRHRELIDDYDDDIRTLTTDSARTEAQYSDRHGGTKNSVRAIAEERYRRRDAQSYSGGEVLGEDEDARLRALHTQRTKRMRAELGLDGNPHTEEV